MTAKNCHYNNLPEELLSELSEHHHEDKGSPIRGPEASRMWNQCHLLAATALHLKLALSAREKIGTKALRVLRLMSITNCILGILLKIGYKGIWSRFPVQIIFTQLHHKETQQNAHIYKALHKKRYIQYLSLGRSPFKML